MVDSYSDLSSKSLGRPISIAPQPLLLGHAQKVHSPFKKVSIIYIFPAKNGFRIELPFSAKKTRSLHYNIFTFTPWAASIVLKIASP